MEIAVIGNSEFILGFRLAGITKTYAAESDEKVVEYVHKVLDDGKIGILVLNSSDMARFQPTPHYPPTQFTRRLSHLVRRGGLSMRERIKRSVGVDLWK